MTGNQFISTMFEINSSIHMVRIVLFQDRYEDPGLGSHFVLCFTQATMAITIFLGFQYTHPTENPTDIYCHIDPLCIVPWLCCFVISQLHCVFFSGYNLIKSWRYGETLYVWCTYPYLVLSWICNVLVGSRALSQFNSSIGMTTSGMIYIYCLMFVCSFRKVLLLQLPYINIL